MAVVRPARSSPPYALIIFVFLWVVSTGLAIFLYVQNGKLAAESEALNKDNEFIVHAKSERGSTTVRDLIATAGKEKRSAIGQAIYQISQLKNRIDGTQGESTAVDELVKKVDNARAGVGQQDTPSLIDSLSAVYKNYQQADAHAKDLANQLRASQEQLTAAKAAYDNSVAAANKNTEDRKADITHLNDDLTKVRADNDTAVKKYETDKTKALADQETAQRELVVKLQQAQDEVTRKQGQIEQLRTKLGLMSPGVKSTIAQEPDGVIIRVSLQTNEVWINLGRKDHVTPGLTFAVYDPKQGVHTGTDADAKGKGGIEVIDVADNESLCRVTHTEKGQGFQVNDLVANPVYNKDKNRKYHFVVYGDFDLDSDGLATPAEKDKIVHLIQSWGGIIDDKVSTQTDFVVVGAMPGSASGKFEVQTEQTEDTLKARKAQQDEYNKIVSLAKDYSIPVLNANRFLSMIGYYNTTVVRY